MGEYMAWLYNGGGLELAREMFHAKGVHNIPCGMIPPGASGWFRKEIKTTADLKQGHSKNPRRDEGDGFGAVFAEVLAGFGDRKAAFAD